MRKFPYVISALALTTTLSLAGNLVQYKAFHKLQADTLQQSMPPVHATGLDDFRAQAYTAPDRWLWHPEARGIARMRADFAPQNHPEYSPQLASLAFGKTPRRATTDILTWYIAHRPTLAAAFVPQLTPARILFCDEDTAIFRSLLARIGIQSRVVNFQFTDGDGGASHTALEVWLPQEGQWIYIDPHYGAYSTTDMLATAQNLTSLTILEPANTEILHHTFTEGMARIAIEGHTPRQRLYYTKM
ncbi:MAG: hypothetical protein EON60_08890 [Alphaproteobacteria bacterium]|nr:MAG: hypothetical protein EON60_08890 [Alphaproteobacteria bacterium]